MFQECLSLKAVTIPDGVPSIGVSAFIACISLTSITIPDSVTHILENAFYNCDSLETVYYSGSEDDWNSIYIEGLNKPLQNAEIVFNHE